MSCRALALLRPWKSLRVRESAWPASPRLRLRGADRPSLQSALRWWTLCFPPSPARRVPRGNLVDKDLRAFAAAPLGWSPGGGCWTQSEDGLRGMSRCCSAAASASETPSALGGVSASPGFSSDPVSQFCQPHRCFCRVLFSFLLLWLRAVFRTSCTYPLPGILLGGSFFKKYFYFNILFY